MTVTPNEWLAFWDARYRMRDISPNWGPSSNEADKALENALRHLDRYCKGKAFGPDSLLLEYSREVPLKDVFSGLKRIRHWWPDSVVVDYEATEWWPDLINGGGRPSKAIRVAAIKSGEIAWRPFHDYLIEFELRDARCSCSDCQQSGSDEEPEPASGKPGSRWWVGLLGEFMAKKKDTAIERQTPEQLECQ